MTPKARAGRVVAVCRRSDSGIPKESQPQVHVGPLGVDGDFHAGPVNRHKKSGDPEPNWRQLTVVAQEVLDAVNAELGTDLCPGSVGENILVEGLGNLADLVEGDMLELGTEVVVRVTRQNRPCATLSVYHQDIVKALLGRRGVTAVVVSTGTVQPGDLVHVRQGAALHPPGQ